MSVTFKSLLHKTLEIPKTQIKTSTQIYNQPQNPIFQTLITTKPIPIFQNQRGNTTPQIPILKFLFLVIFYI